MRQQLEEKAFKFGLEFIFLDSKFLKEVLKEVLERIFCFLKGRKHGRINSKDDFGWEVRGTWVGARGARWSR